VVSVGVASLPAAAFRCVLEVGEIYSYVREHPCPDCKTTICRNHAVLASHADSFASSPYRNGVLPGFPVNPFAPP